MKKYELFSFRKNLEKATDYSKLRVNMTYIYFDNKYAYATDGVIAVKLNLKETMDIPDFLSEKINGARIYCDDYAFLSSLKLATDGLKIYCVTKSVKFIEIDINPLFEFDYGDSFTSKNIEAIFLRTSNTAALKANIKQNKTILSSKKLDWISSLITPHDATDVYKGGVSISISSIKEPVFIESIDGDSFGLIMPITIN